MSNTTRTGKIARLPKAVREELNRRLENSESGRSLTAWLNELPEVRAAMETHFAGSAIREQNLSEWKKGGYQDWRHEQIASAVVAQIYEQDEERKEQTKDRPPISEVVSRWLGARYALATRQVEQAEGPEAWRMLRQMCGDVTRLRRMEQHDRRLEQNDRRLEIEQQRVEIEREKVKLERERFAAEESRSGIPAASRKGSAAGSRRYSGSAASSTRNGGDDKSDSDPTAGRHWEDCSDEEKIAWARQPENFERIEALTKEQKAARVREILRIPHPPGFIHTVPKWREKVEKPSGATDHAPTSQTAP